MVTIKLVGSPHCHRTERIRVLVERVIQKMDIPCRLIELNDLDEMSQYNPLNLPMLFVGKELVAVRNPPVENQIIQAILSEAIKNRGDEKLP